MCERGSGDGRRYISFGVWMNFACRNMCMWSILEYGRSNADKRVSHKCLFAREVTDDYTSLDALHCY